MRTFHRWLMPVALLLLVYWSISGLTLAIFDLTDSTGAWGRDGGGYGAPEPTPLQRADIAPMLQVVTKATQAAAPGAPITALVLRKQEIPLGIVLVGGPEPRRFTFNASTGELLTGGRAAPTINQRALMLMGTFTASISAHGTVKSFHRGSIIGARGVWLALFTGLLLVLLAISGVWMYLEMVSRRRKLGRTQWFWK